MKRKKTLIKNELSNLVFCDSKIKISKDQNNWLYEIGRETTIDVAEAVAIMSLTISERHLVWNLAINHSDPDSIVPEKSLFWLTGGREEWVLLDHFTKNWSDCYLDFQEEFGLLVLHLVKKSSTLGELKKNFSKYLNLPVLYDFALSKGLVK